MKLLFQVMAHVFNYKVRKFVHITFIFHSGYSTTTMLDENLLRINENGELGCMVTFERKFIEYIKKTTPIKKLPNATFKPQFVDYLNERNKYITEAQYNPV